MRLSEAIRLGAMTHPQAFGGYVRYSGFPTKISTCALGAAWAATGHGLTLSERPSLEDLYELFPILRVRVNVPGTCRVLVVDAIVHLNDGKKWTREQIADWVETVEVAHESQLQNVRETTSV